MSLLSLISHLSILANGREMFRHHEGTFVCRREKAECTWWETPSEIHVQVSRSWFCSLMSCCKLLLITSLVVWKEWQWLDEVLQWNSVKKEVFVLEHWWEENDFVTVFRKDAAMPREGLRAESTGRTFTDDRERTAARRRQKMQITTRIKRLLETSH